ncbi:MAG: sugar phosphate nucleotidyltransferase, partial [Lachnospiraceae bacterium]
AEGGEWYKGTANAIYQNMDFINRYNPEYVLILSGDHIYKMDYSKMLEEHIHNRADATIAVLDIPLSEASRFGIMSCNEEGKITRFQEKPQYPESTLASMGIYIFKWSILREALEEDVNTPGSSNDFGKDIIPKLLADGKRLYTYHFDGYWKDVGTISSYYEANMELLDQNSPLDLFDETFRVFSRTNMMPPQYIGNCAKVEDCLISNGCTILGEVYHSILAPGVYVGEGTVIRDSILLPQCKVMGRASITRTIVGEKAVVEESCVLGTEKGEQMHNDGITVVENEHFVPPFSNYEAGQIIEHQGGRTNV